MTVAAIALVAAVLILAALVSWTYILDMSAQRHPPNPRYCGTARCIRHAGHIGTHVDDSGRTWT